MCSLFLHDTNGTAPNEKLSVVLIDVFLDEFVFLNTSSRPFSYKGINIATRDPIHNKWHF